MNNESTVKNFQKTIIDIAVEILGRPLTEKEEKFVTSRSSFVALETILDSVKGSSRDNLEQYLNSES